MYTLFLMARAQYSGVVPSTSLPLFTSTPGTTRKGKAGKKSGRRW
jgi:hypothetical protein